MSQISEHMGVSFTRPVSDILHCDKRHLWVPLAALYYYTFEVDRRSGS